MFHKGDRIKTSEAWLKARVMDDFITEPRHGVIVSEPRGLMRVTVVWDGNKPTSKERIHTSYIELE